MNLIDGINNNIIDTNGIQYFWELLLIFIREYDKTTKGNILIVLDQYKNDKIDEDFKNLNKLSELLESGNLINSFKLMILISINNYDTKEIFLENLSYISFFQITNSKLFPLPKYRSDINEDFNIINNIYKQQNDNDNYELKEIENFLNEKYNEFQTNFKDKLNDNSKNFSLLPNKINSKLILNTKFYNVTKKDYINEIVSCKTLMNNEMDKNYINCIEIFGYSLKYYSLLLYEINNTKKEENEKDEIFSKKVVNNFYKKM